MTNKPMLSVERELLSNLSYAIAANDMHACVSIGKELRALLDEPDEPFNLQGWSIDHSAGRPILMHNKCSVIEAEQAYGLLNLIESAAQHQGEPVELSTEELRFLEAVSLNPGSKLNGGIACGEEGNSLWPRLEALGLIECLGSYKWQLTFSAFEMGVKAFLGMRPAPVAVVMPARKPQRITDEYARGWNDYDAEYKRLNGVKP